MPQWFLQFCEATGPQLAHLGSGMSSATGEQLLLAFLDRWLDKFDSIGTPAARKLSALALCNVLTLPVTLILDRLDPIAAHLTSVWFEVRPVNTPVTCILHLCWLPALLYVRPQPSVSSEVYIPLLLQCCMPCLWGASSSHMKLPSCVTTWYLSLFAVPACHLWP